MMKVPAVLALLSAVSVAHAASVGVIACDGKCVSTPGELGLQARAHEVRSLPGFTGSFPSQHYSGYLSVNSKRLFYYFVTSERSPETDPVVLWLNGGPGCSSFDGFCFENGPFTFNLKEDTVELKLNKYSWSKVASTLYLDSPAGVGLSYSEDRDDYATNDTATAAASYAFLQQFFQLFQSYAKLPFYIAGESFAGVYIPTLVREVVEGNAAGKLPHIHLKGYAIGNGVTDEEVDGDATIPFAFYKSLISSQQYAALTAACNGSFWKPVEGSQCAALISEATIEVAKLNLYDVLLPCFSGSAARAAVLRGRLASLDSHARTWPYLGPARAGRMRTWHDILGTELGDTPPCLDHRELNAWLDQAEVRRALHAAPEEVTGRFQECTNALNYTHDQPSMLANHRFLLSKGVRVLIYNGDHDLCVPHTGAEAWTRGLGLPPLGAWGPWLVNGQVAGYKQAYASGLTYATVLGAGHFVPECKPVEALHMITRFLADKPL